MKAQHDSAGNQELKRSPLRDGTLAAAKSFRRYILEGISKSTTCFHRLASRTRKGI
jgi:hypothetical protein